MRLAFVLTGQMLAASSLLPIEMWQAAAETVGGRRRGRAPLETVTVSVDGAPVPTQAGLRLAPQASLAHAGPLDVGYLPALWRNPRPQIAKSRALLPWLQAQAARGGMIAAVGTG